MHTQLSKALLYCIEALRGEHVFSYLRELELNQNLSRHEITQLQHNKLIKLLEHSISNNKYYSSKFAGYDIYGDYDNLPILTKTELRDKYNDILSNTINSKLDLVETSGSTGVPLKFYRDRVVFGYTLASVYRAHGWWGLDIGSKEAMLWGVPVSIKGKIKTRFKDLLLNRFREREYNINAATLHDFYQKILYKKPEYIFGYSSMVYEFALYLKESGLSIERGLLKAAICTAEGLYESQRDLIEEVLKCNVVTEYGATETGIISYECKHKSNHISDDCVYVEIVDDDNHAVPDGVSGRVLVTVLNSYSAPIIRYDLGDISSKLNYKCSCGINLSVLGKVEGRSTDVAVSPDGNIYHSIIFYYIMKELTEKIGGVRKYKVIQRQIDELDVYLVKDSSYSEQAELFLKQQLRDKFGESMNIKLLYKDNIDRMSSGKYKDFETHLNIATILADRYRR